MIDTIKVQRPLFPPDGPWLIYGKGPKNMQIRPAAAVPKPVKAAMGNDHRAFFIGHWSPGVGWTIGDRVPNEPW